jgi:polyketide cyclase/dehydrase/lipid transport protein
VISLVETTRIPAAPERVWRFLRELDAHYPDWHPEHLTWRTLRGEPLSEGAICFADEWVGPLRVTGRFFILVAVPERFFAYRFGFPASLVGAGGWFRLAPTSNGDCELTVEAHLGSSAPLIGRLVDRVLAAALPLGEIRRHMREEGENLVRLLAQPS